MMSTSEVALYRVADMQGQNWPELAIPWRYLSDTHPKHCQRPQIDPFVFSFPLLFFTQICSSIFISTNHVYPCMAIGPSQERYYRFFLAKATGLRDSPGQVMMMTCCCLNDEGQAREKIPWSPLISALEPKWHGNGDLDGDFPVVCKVMWEGKYPKWLGWCLRQLPNVQ